MKEPLIECVPNFSEGRDSGCIARLASAIASVTGVRVLDQTSDWDHHRSVITFAGYGDSVVEAALRATAQAAKSIDLRKHRGIHPRLGALDVLPFVPLGSSTMEDCVTLARRAGQRIVEELGIPVYFYGEAALRPDRVALENVRRGQFEELAEVAPKDPSKAPDLGGPHLHPTAGAVIVGARNILVAYNINLKSTDLEIAREIARRIRASSGGFPSVKALGLPLVSRNLVQVSMNLTDINRTPLHVVYEAVSQLAAARGVEIDESELIGLLPRAVMERAFAHFVKLPHFSPQNLIEDQAEPLIFKTVDLRSTFLPGEKTC